MKTKNEKQTAERGGFTFVELLITTSLLVLVGVALYSALSSGIKVWKRARQVRLEDEISIFYEKFFSDIRNTFFSQVAWFQGQEQLLTFPALVVFGNKGKTVGEVTYRFNEDDGLLFREARNYSQFYTNEESRQEALLKNIVSLRFFYYTQDPLTKEYLWEEEWRKKRMPLAVRIEMAIEHESEEVAIARTFSIPTAHGSEL